MKYAIDSKRFLNGTIVLLLFISQSSCFQHFYQINTATKVDTAMFSQPSNENNYFIVHTPTEVFSLKNVKVSDGILMADKDRLNPEYEKYLNPEEGETKRLKGKEAETIFKIVHIYTKETVENGHVNLPVNQIIKVEDYRMDKAADKRSKTISIIGIVAVPVVIVVFGISVSNNLNF